MGAINASSMAMRRAVGCSAKPTLKRNIPMHAAMSASIKPFDRRANGLCKMTPLQSDCSEDAATTSAPQFERRKKPPLEAPSDAEPDRSGPGRRALRLDKDPKRIAKGKSIRMTVGEVFADQPDGPVLP